MTEIYPSDRSDSEADPHASVEPISRIRTRMVRPSGATALAGVMEPSSPSLRATGSLGGVLEAYRHDDSNESDLGDRSVRLFDGVEGIDATASSERFVLEGKARFISGLRLRGAEHRSAGEIDEFTEAGAQAAHAGKFGKGSYFSVGPLSGETMDSLRSTDTYMHSATIQGNFLLVDRSSVKDVEAQLMDATGTRKPGFKTSIRNADLTSLLEHFEFEEGVLDGVILVMDDASTAELLVFPQSTKSIQLDGVEFEPGA